MEYSVNGMNVDANRTCGKCLSQIRREQGITQVELAKKLRVYEQFAYAEALGITVGVLVQRLEAVLSSGDK